MKKIIEVTKTNIKNGKRWSAINCPIALALKREGFKYVHISMNGLSFKPKNEYGIFTRYMMPTSKCKNFMRRFDTQLPVKPFKFQLSY